MRETANIFNIQRYSLHDGGGIRTIVFFKGCPFTCPWCCNPESLSTSPQLFYKESLCMDCSKKENGICNTLAQDCPTGAKEIIGEKKSVEEINDFIKKDYAFYDSSNGGVTLSGGECLLQSDVAIQILKKCKENNIHTAIETTMALSIPNLKQLVDVCDVFLIDFKIFDSEDSKKILHLDIQQLKQNIDILLSNHAKIIPRIPLIPNYTMQEENLYRIIEYLKEKQLYEVHLLPFHQLGEAKYKSMQKDYTCQGIKPPCDVEIEKIQNLFQKNGFKTLVHG